MLAPFNRACELITSDSCEGLSIRAQTKKVLSVLVPGRPGGQLYEVMLVEVKATHGAIICDPDLASATVKPTSTQRENHATFPTVLPQ